MSGISQFLEFQKYHYETALKEIQQGKKESDWMSYIYPQIEGLSFISRYTEYDIKDFQEGKKYLENETLKERIINVTQALLELNDVNIKDVFGDDEIKLKSSLTLLKRIEETFNINCYNVFKKALDKFFNGEEDKETIDIIEKQKNEINKFNLVVEEQNEEKENEQNIYNLNNNIQEKENQIEPINKEDKNNNDEMKIVEQNDDEMKIVEENNDEMKIEEQNDDEMKIEEQNDDEMKIVEENVVLDAGKKEEKEPKKVKFSNNESNEKKETDMVIKEENVNLLENKVSNNNVNSSKDLRMNITNNVDDNLKKKKSIHFSLPSRSQMKKKNNTASKSEIEMLINSKKLIDKDTILINPYDEESEKKCCPDCNIF